MREMGEKNKAENKTPCAEATRLKEQEEKLNPSLPTKLRHGAVKHWQGWIQ